MKISKICILEHGTKATCFQNGKIICFDNSFILYISNLLNNIEQAIEKVAKGVNCTDLAD